MKTWLKASGASGLDDLELADFSSTGRGVKTLRRFEANHEILTIPHSVLWTVDHAHADPIFGPALRDVRPSLSVDDTLASYILFVRSCRQKEERYDGLREHIAALPTRYTSSVFFNEDELEICAGSSLYTTTHHLNMQLEKDYESLVKRLFEPHREWFPRERTTLGDYKWALCTVWSRAMDFQLDDTKSLRLIAPFADMLNHAPIVGQCHAYDPRSGTLSVLAGKSYDPGDQVFINYGPVPNNRLLRLYGFVMPDNPHDCYELVLTTHPAAPLFEQKLSYWQSAGLDSTCNISLTLAEPLPRKLLQYLRIQRLNESDLTAIIVSRKGMDLSEPLSDSNEMEILTALVESIGMILGGFRIPLETFEEQLAKGTHTPGGNAWAAAHVSIGEQRVLRSTKQQAETLLLRQKQKVARSGKEGGSSPMEENGAGCANCGSADAKLMRCGRCNQTAYCGRSCQVAHYKVHKPSCQSILKTK